MKRAIDWPDPYLSLKIVEKNPDGIVVRGAKINISGAYACDELVVLPQNARTENEADYAVAFAVPSDAEGITYVCQYSPYSADGSWPTTLMNLAIHYSGKEKPRWLFSTMFSCRGSVYSIAE